MVIADDPRSMDELGELSARERALKRELIEHLRRDIYVKLAPSSIEGVGVIAVRDVPAGVKVLTPPETVLVHIVQPQAAPQHWPQ